MVPKYSGPKSQNLGMLPCMTRVTVDFIKDFEMERLFWIITVLLQEKGRGRFDYGGKDIEQKEWKM